MEKLQLCKRTVSACYGYAIHSHTLTGTSGWDWTGLRRIKNNDVHNACLERLSAKRARLCSIGHLGPPRGGLRPRAKDD